jgi:signal transduction histidine kinase
MSAQISPAGVDRLEDRLTRALTTPWAWIALAGLLLIAAAAQAGFDDRFLTSIVIVLPVAVVVRHPRPAVAIAVFAALGLLFSPSLPIAGGIGLAIVCTVAGYRFTAAEIWVIGGLFLVNAVTPFGASGPGAATYLLFAVVIAALGFGRLLRSRSTVIAEREALALAHTATVREHLLLVDRTAIARELHDVVAHHISHIAIQAETARYTTPDLPELADARLTEIGESARTALAEMRRVLTVIRAPGPHRAGAPAGRPDPALQPRPGLGQLDALVEVARGHGTAVAVTVSGLAVAIPADTDLVAYRVIQESLTNARRHAPGADVDIALHHGPGTLRLTIHNDVPPGPTPPGPTPTGPTPTGPTPTGPIGPTDQTGLGLLGMRERVDAVGGALRHGPLPGGGFTVAVELPLRPDR